MYYQVYVEDHITHEKVVVLDLATRTEALDIARFLSQYNACSVYIVESEFFFKKGKHEI